MARFLRYCLCCFLSLPALAFSADRVVVVEPGQITRTYEPGSGPYAYSDSRSWKEPVSTQSGARVNVPVKTDRKYGWPSFRAGLKKALKLNPVRVAVSAAVSAAVAGAGYVIDSATNQIAKPQSQLDGMPASPSSITSGGSLCGSGVPASELIGKVKYVSFQGQTIAYTVVRSNGPALWPEPSGYTFSNNCTNKTIGYTHDGGYYPKEFKRQVLSLSEIQNIKTPLTDGELDTFVNNWSSPFDAADAVPHIVDVPVTFDGPDDLDFSGPASMAGDPVVTTTTTPSGTEVTTSTPTYSFDYSTNPLSITTTTTNTSTVYNNGTLVSTSTTTNNQGVVDVTPEPSQEIPTDCEFMPTVCEFIAWFKTPAPMPEPDMPEPVDDDFKQTYSASFGGACPAPRQVHTDNFGTLSISWDPICQLAFYIKFLVVGGAALYAAYIGLGISRGNA